MAAKIGTVVLDARDVKRATAFWSAALGYDVTSASETWVSLDDPAKSGVGIGLQPNAEPKPDVNRVHLDVHADDVEAEVARLVRLGATRIPWEYAEGATYVVLQDTEGNEFCVVPA